jgi:hypothetical protein
MKQKVYIAMCNPMIHESCYGVISVHKTRKGAEMAMEFNKAEALREHEKTMKERKADGDTFDYGKYDDFKAWNIFEFEVIN